MKEILKMHLSRQIDRKDRFQLRTELGKIGKFFSPIIKHLSNAFICSKLSISGLISYDDIAKDFKTFLVIAI